MVICVFSLLSTKIAPLHGYDIHDLRIFSYYFIKDELGFFQNSATLDNPFLFKGQNNIGFSYDSLIEPGIYAFVLLTFMNIAKILNDPPEKYFGISEQVGNDDKTSSPNKDSFEIVHKCSSDDDYDTFSAALLSDSAETSDDMSDINDEINEICSSTRVYFEGYIEHPELHIDSLGSSKSFFIPHNRY